jgi:hypothetical protein
MRSENFEKQIRWKCFSTAVKKSEHFGKFISIRRLIVCVALFMHFDALSLRDAKLIKYVRKLKSCFP